MPSQVLAILIRMRSRLDAPLLVERDELARLGDRPVGVEAQAGVDLGGDAAGNDLEDLAAEEDEELIDELPRHFFVPTAALESELGGLFDQVPVSGHLGGVKEQRRIGGGVLRPVPGNGFDVTRVRHNRRVFLAKIQATSSFSPNYYPRSS